MLIKGEFKVELKPIESYAKGSAGVKLGRMAIEKTFLGDLVCCPGRGDRDGSKDRDMISVQHGLS